ncbi:ribonuclease R [Aquabacterium fontiphilum]|uniref:ribonuclease R n=1 Tax=Aquabacterium fontiphilum TaxID=450365 RepID=UPI001376CED6|nr:ribonuclease R [Aquabacterium fontiphilum]NBD21503.1 ribonuclease R [Aquabacterium fontiphilum]
MSEIDGTVQGHRDGHGFVLSDDGAASVYLSPQEMRAVMHRDRVKVRVVRFDRKGRPEGLVLDILERRSTTLIGRLLHEGGVWLVAPEDRRYGQDVLVPAKGTGKAQPGQVVVVQLTEPPTLHAQPVGKVVEVLGEIDDPGMEIEIAVRKYEVPHQFAEDTLAQAQKLPEKVRPVDKRNRVDLTDVALVTIDGEDARDFDDAVYCEPVTVGRSKAPNGWRLLVAIADVSHYVKPGEALDRDAYERATSVYFPRRVIPMLPEKLSNGLCSLNPDVDRLCMVCDMVITHEGEIHAYQFYPAVMHSHARFTYTEVAAILGNTRGPEAVRREALVPHLLHLHEVYRALLKGRTQRGAVDFDTTETQIVCDDNGRIAKIVPRVRTEAHRLIEECMLAANVCSADFILRARHPSLYRVHEGPTPEKRETLKNYLKALGLGLSLGEEPRPGDFQAIAQATKDRPDATQIHTMLLRSMQQAVYTPVNAGHFGLAYEAYTHFTSPIRRYPDLLVHRVIKALLGRERYKLALPPSVVSSVGTFRKPGSKGLVTQGLDKAVIKAAKGKLPPAEAQAWETAGIHCSANERRADEASRDVEAWLKCMFMRERLGEEYAGTVTAATSFGLFVQLDGLYVEGLIHVTELGGEYYRFDEVRQELRGERTGVRYGIGARVRVQVSRVDLDTRKIDFRMVPESSEGRAGSASPSRRKGKSAGQDTWSAQDELAEIREADRMVKRSAGARGAREESRGASSTKSAGPAGTGARRKGGGGKPAASRKSARGKR